MPARVGEAQRVLGRFSTPEHLCLMSSGVISFPLLNYTPSLWTFILFFKFSTARRAEGLVQECLSRCLNLCLCWLRFKTKLVEPCFLKKAPKTSELLVCVWLQTEGMHWRCPLGVMQPGQACPLSCRPWDFFLITLDYQPLALTLGVIICESQINFWLSVVTL